MMVQVFAAAALAAAAVVAAFTIGLVGLQPAAALSLRKGFLGDEPPAQVSGRDNERYRALSTSTDELVCRNGFPGIESNDACCSLECGACGGVGCSLRPGGGDSCCVDNIEEDGSPCSEVGEAPCYIDVEIPVPSPSECINGFAGIQSGDVCCSLECGACGGVACSLRPGGEDACCTSNILDEGSSCNEVDSAPCFFGGDGITPDTTPTPTATATCSGGIPGIELDSVCCAVECGICGGLGCHDRPGGEDYCCTSMILDAGDFCGDVGEAPCIIEVEPTPNPTMMPTTASTCSNDLPGVQRDNICCTMGCGICGGFGCHNLPGGEDSCCASRIEEAGALCSDVGEAPCIIDDPPTPTPTVMPTNIPTEMPTMMPTTASTCTNGLPGVQRDNICCMMGCGTCGGSKCNTLPGGAESCCTSRIEEAGALCSDVGEAPCIIDDPPTPTPTVMPTMMPTEMPTMMPTTASTCTNGLPGVERENICCAMGCGICGGFGCSNFPGGRESCCTSRIDAAGVFCNDVDAGPCIIEDPPTPSPTMMPTMVPTMVPTMIPTVMPTMIPTPLLVCSNGLPGVQLDNVCCAKECGECGGNNCHNLPGGAESCCTSRVLAANVFCDVVDEGPCIIAPTPAPTTETPTTIPTGMPTTESPTMTLVPTTSPPTLIPTDIPTGEPTTMVPTGTPTTRPSTMDPSPTTSPPTMTPFPTTSPPTMMPTDIPTGGPTTMVPTGTPTTRPSTMTPSPTTSPPTMTPIPTASPPTMMPTDIPTGEPTTVVPTGTPTMRPSTIIPIPTTSPPTMMATVIPTGEPTNTVPTGTPTTGPPTMTPIPTTSPPTMMATDIPTGEPTTMMPTGAPTTESSTMTPIPTTSPPAMMSTDIPTGEPTTMVPTGTPTTGPSTMTLIPTTSTMMATAIPTVGPTTTVPTTMLPTGPPMSPNPTIIPTTIIPTVISTTEPPMETSSPTMASTVMMVTLIPTLDVDP